MGPQKKVTPKGNGMGRIELTARLIKELGFPVVICCAFGYALWHFGNIAAQDYKETTSVLRQTMQAQSMAIESQSKSMVVIAESIASFNVAGSERTQLLMVIRDEMKRVADEQVKTSVAVQKMANQ